MKNFIFLLSFIISALASFTAFAQQEPTQAPSQGISQETQQFTEAELAQMLAPIALYPDSLLTHILIAATYPIEIVEAHRWLVKNDELNSAQLAKSVEDFNWDASVKALVPFERILSRLSEDLTWTQQLGDAFLQDEERLLASIQVLRQRAKLAGNLDKMDNMAVSYEDDNITIAPREKEIIYVPYYDTRMVYGAWYWSSYPPVYWTPHRSVYVSHYSPFYWDSGIHISFNYFFSAFNWQNRHVIVTNSHNSYNRYYHQRPRRLIANGGYAKRWVHQPTHRKGVAYRSKRTSQKYQSKRISNHQTNRELNSTQHNNTKRHFEQRLAVQSHSSSTRQANKAQVNSKTHTRTKLKARHDSMPYLANVKESNQIKEHKQKREGNENLNLKSDTSKSDKEKANRHNATPTKTKRYNSSKKQRHQNKSAKSHSSSLAKARHK